MNMKLALLTAAPLAALLYLAGCDARSVHIETDPGNTTYSRDKRTDLCFASLGRADGGSFSDKADSFSMTNVPCTPAVLALVPKSQGGGL